MPLTALVRSLDKLTAPDQAVQVVSGLPFAATGCNPRHKGCHCSVGTPPPPM